MDVRDAGRRHLCRRRRGRHPVRRRRYIYTAGDGNDAIGDTGAESDVDSLWLSDLKASDVTLGRSLLDARDLVVTINATAEVITVSSQFFGIGIEQLQFSDGTSLDRSQIAQAAWLRGTPDADWISGTPGDDTFVGGGGDDVQDGGDGSDTYIYAAGRRQRRHYRFRLRVGHRHAA